MKYLPLSPNELEALQRKQESEVRRRRLISLRQSERERSRKQTELYEQEYEQALDEIIESIQTDWSHFKSKEIESLQLSIANAETTIGQGYKSARVASEVHHNENVRLKLQYLSELLRENQRSNEAAQKLHEEMRAVEGHRLEVQEHLSSVRLNEARRAKNIARMYRLAHPVDILNPHDASHASGKYKDRMDRINCHRGRRYDDTYYNKDFAVVRTDYEDEADSSRAKGPNANNMAKIVLEKLKTEERKRAEKVAFYEQRKHERFEKALYSVKMEKEREEMIKELDKIQLADRRRKQLMVDTRSHIHSTTENEQQKQMILTRLFERKFKGLDDEVIISRVIHHPTRDE